MFKNLNFNNMNSTRKIAICSCSTKDRLQHCERKYAMKVVDLNFSVRTEMLWQIQITKMMTKTGKCWQPHGFDRLSSQPMCHVPSAIWNSEKQLNGNVVRGGDGDEMVINLFIYLIWELKIECFVTDGRYHCYKCKMHTIFSLSHCHEFEWSHFDVSRANCVWLSRWCQSESERNLFTTQ